MSVTPVILCGGSGTRLWPLSRTLYPKQFMDLGGKTLFGDTLARAAALPNVQDILVVCNEEHRFLARAIIHESGFATGAEAPAPAVRALLLESSARNTAPAIALAAFYALNTISEPTADPVLCVLPSDHSIAEPTVLHAAVAQASAYARQGHLVTFGVQPTYAATGFGYIRRGVPLALKGEPSTAFTVAQFVEKPSADAASALLASGDCLWNSGIFVFTASAYLKDLQTHAPNIYAACSAACNTLHSDTDFVRPSSAFAHIPAQSIDYAVMEHTRHAAVLPLAVEWSDLGSWEALYAAALRDTDDNVCHNVCRGDVLCNDSTGCYLHSSHRLVAALGLCDTVVVETADAVLVAPRERSEEVKALVETLAADKRPEKDSHVKVHRPWGTYEVLSEGLAFQVKRIVVHPGARLSLQMHRHRAEHWVVVSGSAKVTVGESVRFLNANQSTYIERESRHRLENPGSQPLIIIEIQTGDYLGEDDIMRFEDSYSRA